LPPLRHLSTVGAAMLKSARLAANPNRAMLITRKERWFHWLTANTRASRTSKASVEPETRKTAVSIGSYS
jgi:hypothetical protein